MKYVGKQKALALAMMAMFASGSAYAAFDMNATTPTTNKYAQQINTAGGTAALQQAGTGMNIQFTIGSSGGGKPDLVARVVPSSSGKWSDSVSASVKVYTDDTLGTELTGGSVTASVYVPSDTTKKGYLIINMSGTNGYTFEADDVVVIEFATSTDILIPGGATTTLTRELFDNTGAAENSSNPFGKIAPTTAYVSLEGDVFDIDNAAVGTVSNQPINVKDGSLSFTSTGTDQIYTVNLCNFNIQESDAFLKTGVAANDDNRSIDVLSTTASDTKLRVTGNFSMLVDDTGEFEKGRLFLGDNGGCAASAADSKTAIDSGATATIATSLSATEATFDVGNLWLNEYVTGAEPVADRKTALCMIVPGDKPIPVSEIAVAYEPKTTDDDENYTVDSPKSLGTCATLEKNGSTASAAMTMVNGFWSQRLRITNPSNTGGKVHVYAINDTAETGTDGVTRYGPWSFDLDAGQSTGMMTIENILDGIETATTVRPKTSEELGKTATSANLPGEDRLNKLRIYVEGEFGEGHNGVKGGDATDGVILRAYLVPNPAAGGTFDQID